MADCPNLATASDIQNVMAAINALSAKIPTDVATKSDIAGLNSQIAQLTERVRSLESQLSASNAALEAIKTEQQSQKGILSNIPDWLDGLWGKIQGLFEWVGRKISDAAQWIWDKVTDAAAFLAGKVGEVFNWVGDRAQWVWSKVDSVAGFLAGKVGEVFNWVGDRAQWVWDKVENVAGFLAGKVGEVFNWVGDRAQWVWDKVQGVGELIWSGIKELSGGISVLGDRIESRFNGILQPIMDVLRTVFGLPMAIADLYVKLLLKIDEFGQWIRDRVWEAAQWLWDQIFGRWSNAAPDPNNGGGTGGNGSTSCQFSQQQTIEISGDLQYIRDELDKLNGFVLGDLDSQQSVSLNPEAEMRGLIGSLFSSDMMGNSAANVSSLKEMLMAIAAVLYGRAGYQDYPISVPALPLDSGNPPLAIVTASRFQSWQTKFIDNGIGMFPFEIKIKDSDLIKVGSQELNIKFPNIAETLAEIFGLLVVDKALSETNTQVGFKCLAELGALRKQGYLSHKLIAAITSYLGFKTKQKKEKLSLSFNPLVGVDGSEDRIAEALKPKKVDIVVEIEDEDNSLEEKLAILLEAAAITKGVNFEKLNETNKDEVIQHYKDLADTTEEDSEFDVFLEEFERGFISRPNITDQLNPYGRAYSRRPKVKEIGLQNDAEPTQEGQ